MSPADILRVKALLPTDLGTSEIRERYAKDILSRAVFSARVTSARYLKKVREVAAALAEGSIDQATARKELLVILGELGHSPQDAGGLKNPASIRRLNLVLDTQRQMAASVAILSEQTDATIHAFPAWHLTRLESRRNVRDWALRWKLAGQSVGFEGALKNVFIALKWSPIWQALGQGVGGFTDALGNPYPPFAFSSGMDWTEVDRSTCVRLGLVKPDSPDGSVASPRLTPAEREIADAIERFGFPNLAEGLA